MSETVDLVVIGAGQAGLSLSYELSRASVEHVVLERGRVGESWRGRWDSFCLVTPNWSMQLPGGTYQGPDPHGFMPSHDYSETGSKILELAKNAQSLFIREFAGAGTTAQTTGRLITTGFGSAPVQDYVRFQELHTRHHSKQMAARQ